MPQSKHGSDPVPGDWGGPYVAAAFFCEAATRDPDESWSFERIHYGAVMADRPGTYTEPIFVLSLVGGREPGRKVLDIFGQLPGESRVRVAGPDQLVFDGPAHVHVIAQRIVVRTDNEGIAWFDVVVDGRLLTRMPYSIQREFLG
jgi:hypothetical protein